MDMFVDVVPCVTDRTTSGSQENEWSRLWIRPMPCLFADNSAEKWCNEIITVWRAFPDPYPTVSQIRQVLYLFFGRSGRVKEAVKAITDHYVSIRPNCRNGKTPRSLKHLSRCAIRKVLKMNEQLPFGISELEIPDELKSYLELKY